MAVIRRDRAWGTIIAIVVRIAAALPCLLLAGCAGLSFGEIAFIHSTNATLSKTSKENVADKGLDGQAFQPPHMEFAKLPHNPDKSTYHLKFDCTITEEGKVAQPIALNDSPSENPTLNTQAFDAMGAWRFKPATIDGKPVPVRVVIVAQIDPDGVMYRHSGGITGGGWHHH